MLCLHKILTSGSLHSGEGYEMIEWLMVELFCHPLALDPKVDSEKMKSWAVRRTRKVRNIRGLVVMKN